MGRQSTVDKLPEAVRQWLRDALEERNYSGYAELEVLLRESGYVLSRSAIHRYGRKLEKRLAAIRAGTEGARMVVEVAGDDMDARSEAVIALVQTEMFESIVNLQEASEEGIDPEQRIKLLSAAAKNVGTLARASVNQKKFRLELQARAEAVAANVERIVREGGLTRQAGEDLRAGILGIVR